MKSFNIQNRRPPNDPADFVANRVNLPGVAEVEYDAENDQMQVGRRASDHGAVAESVYIYSAIKTVMLIRSPDQIVGPALQKSAISSSLSWKNSNRSRKLGLAGKRSTFATVLGRRS